LIFTALVNTTRPFSYYPLSPGLIVKPGYSLPQNEYLGLLLAQVQHGWQGEYIS
jgi:hypothetical protein